VLPDWAVRLLVGTLLLPALLTALDGFFRVRRRHLPLRPWLIWLGASALPLLLAWIWARALGITGALEPPGAPMLPLPPLDRAGAVALGSVAVVILLGWFGIRPLLLRRAGERGSPVAGSLAAVSGAALCTLASLVWVVNPYAAALLIPALHVWLFALAPDLRMPRALRLFVVVLGALPVVIVAIALARSLGLGAVEAAWELVLLTAGGHVSLPSVLLWSVVAGCGVGAVLVAAQGHTPVGEDEIPITVRGPKTYAGPGSLGGTESALRR
jgi:hypothetical protein